MAGKLRHILFPALTGAVVLAVWYGIHFWLTDDLRFLLPTPADVVHALVVNAASLSRAALNTAEGALCGFLLAVIVGIALSLSLSLSSVIRTSLYPYLMAMQLTPLPILAPICVIWVGAGLHSVALLTFLICFFPLVVNTTQGLISTDRHLVEFFRMSRATRLQEILFLRVPGALPYFFTGLRIAATLAPIGAVVSDMNAGSSAGDGGGLGFQATIYSSQAKYPALFATAAATCVLGFVFNAVILSLSWYALHHWHDSYERTDK